VSAPDGAQLSEDGRYWWDGEQWQLIEATTDPSASSESPEEIFSGSFIQQLMASSGEIAEAAVQSLLDDPEMKALHDTDPSEFTAIITDIVQGALQE
jgi:hypothetical protein